MTSVARLDVENLPQQRWSCQPATTGRPRHDWSMRLLDSNSRRHGRQGGGLKGILSAFIVVDLGEQRRASHCFLKAGLSLDY